MPLQSESMEERSPLALLQQYKRPEQKKYEKKGKLMSFHSLCIGQMMLTYLAEDWKIII